MQYLHSHVSCSIIHNSKENGDRGMDNKVWYMYTRGILLSLTKEGNLTICIPGAVD